MRWGKRFLIALAFVASGVLGYLARGTPDQGIQPHQRYHFDDSIADTQMGTLYATGTWRGGDIASPINTVRIWCDRSNRTCEMIQADVTTLGSSSLLGLYTATFSISQLDAKLLTAINESAVCVRQTLVIDRQARTVSMVRTKKSKEELCGMIQDEPLTISLANPR